MKLKLIILFLSLSPFIYSQNQQGFKINYNWDHIGDNIETCWLFKIKNHTLSSGILFFLNLEYYNNAHWGLKKQYYATNFSEHIGLNLEYRYNFNLNNSDLIPYAYYNLHVFRNRIRYDNLLIPYGRYENKDLYFEKDDLLSEPLFSFQNSVGFGIAFQIFRSVDFFAQTGVGITYLPLKNTPIAVYKQREFSANFTIGAVYNFKRKK